MAGAKIEAGPAHEPDYHAHTERNDTVFIEEQALRSNRNGIKNSGSIVQPFKACPILDTGV
jgi:hypothetical protein